MREVKQIEIKNRTYYFYNDMISIKHFESSLLEIGRKHYKGINIYYIGNITIKKIHDCKNTYSVNPLYLLINHASGYIEGKIGKKYLIFDDYVNDNKPILNTYADVWDEFKRKSKQQMVVKNIIMEKIT